jgi:hypothetical protein
MSSFVSFRSLWNNSTSWFQYFDHDRSNSLDKDEVIQGLLCTFSDTMDTSAIFEFIEALWPLFDTDNSGKISFQEFVQSGGLYETINAQIHSISKQSSTTQATNTATTSSHTSIYTSAQPIMAPTVNTVHANLSYPSPVGMVRGAQVKRALLIGVNYFNTSAKLNGCINDTQNIRDMLISVYGWRPADIVVLRDDSNAAQYQPTHANILQAMQWLVNGAKRGDCFFFSFSGHGTQQPDPHGYEEDGMNECILPVDFKTKGTISDDMIASMIVHPLPEGARLTAVLDSCHSGTGLDLPFEWTDRGWKEEVNPFFVTADVQMFSGCTDDGTSCDIGAIQGAAGGALTTAFCSILRANPCPTYVELLASLRRRMRESGLKQHPLLASTQAFDFNRPFHLEDAVPNSNRQLGRVVKRHFPPRGQPDPLRGMLFGDGRAGGLAAAAVGVLGGVMLADMFLS